MTKKNVLLISSVYIVYFVSILLMSANCPSISKWCRIREDDLLGLTLMSFMPFAPVFLFSLITYRMKEEVFQAWWNFACWFIPIVIIVTFLLNMQSGGGGLGIGGAVSEAFDFLILFVLYFVFILTSSIIVFGKYRKTKNL